MARTVPKALAMNTTPRVRFLDRSTPPHIATLIIMTGVSAMAMNMFLPSLPSMTEYFQTEYHLMQVSVGAFLAVNAALQLVVGPLSDRYGRRPVTLAGFAIFAFGTIGCLVATNIYVFLGFRAVQAASVVAMVLGRAAIRDVFDRDEATRMISYVTMGMAVIPMVTPALGGWLDQTFSWKATFLVLLAAGAGTFALIWADFGETNRHQRSSFGQQIRDVPELLTSPRFWGYAGSAALSSGAFFAYLGGAPFIGSELYGLDPKTLGFFFGTPGAGYIVGNYLSARNVMRVGGNRLILAGALVSAAGLGATVILVALGYDSPWTFFGMMTLLGLGNGLVIPNGTAGMLSVRPQLAGTASGLGGALMIGGGAALAGWAGSLLSPETGAMPLILIQFVVCVMSCVAILLVMQRERRLLRA